MNEAAASQDVVRGVISSFGFPAEKVDQAVSFLYDEFPANGPHGGPWQIYSFRRTCEVLSLSKSGLRRIIDSGELRPVRLSSRRIGFRSRDVQAFIASRETA